MPRPVDHSRWPRVDFAATAARRCRRRCAVVRPRRTIPGRGGWGDDEKARGGRIQRGAVSRRETRIGQHRAGVTSRPSPIAGRHPGRRGRLASARRCGRHGGGVCSPGAITRDRIRSRRRHFPAAVARGRARDARGRDLPGLSDVRGSPHRHRGTCGAGRASFGHGSPGALSRLVRAAWPRDCSQGAADAAIGAASALAIYIRAGLAALPASAVEPRQLLLFGATG